MRRIFVLITLLFTVLLSEAQQQYHVAPANRDSKPGLPNGSGSMDRPWDLQTALNKTDVLKAGDTLWLHKGIYDGRFESTIAGKANKPIVVLPYKNAKVILNGNVGGKKKAVLRVKGGYVEFHDLEITFKGEFSRKQGEEGFQKVHGIEHNTGEDCSFINLKIHNNPGSGIGSWKNTGGSKIIGCRIFENGYFSKVRGSGVGIYVQNLSNKERLIKDNFVFNNYYKGIEVWSASSGSKMSYIRNVTLLNNVVFNNGLPGKRYVDNVIVASGDADGINLPKNIKLLNNVLYHNVDFTDQNNYGDGASLTLGYSASAPIIGTTVKENVIVGRNNGLRILHAKELTFKENKVYSGYAVMYKSVLKHMNSKNWKFSDNHFFTRRSYPFRIEKHKDYKIKHMREEFGIDAGKWKYLKEFDLPELLHKSKSPSDPNEYRVALFEKQNKSVDVSFIENEIYGMTFYKIKDLATGEVISEGKIGIEGILSFPMNTQNLTNRYFNVYSVEFSSEEETKKKKRSFFNKIFGWLF